MKEILQKMVSSLDKLIQRQSEYINDLEYKRRVAIDLQMQAQVDFLNQRIDPMRTSLSEYKDIKKDAERALTELSKQPKPTETKEREFPCEICDTGEMVVVGSTSPSGLQTYECTECGDTKTFP